MSDDDHQPATRGGDGTGGGAEAATPESFVESLAAVRLDPETVFNPYSDRCPVYDLENAPELRRENLISVLKAAMNLGVDSVWVGQEPGHKGARRTGLALTDDRTLDDMSKMFGGALVARATRPSHMREDTAHAAWKVLSQLDCRVFPWNVFPLHSHEQGKPLSNRKHDSKERAVGIPFLCDILTMLKPGRIVAIGAIAEDVVLCDTDVCAALARVPESPKCYAVRHPARGGEGEFFPTMGKYYGLKLDRNGKKLKEISV